jgi:hypothetical protein
LGWFCELAVGGRTCAWGGCCELSVCICDWFWFADGLLFCCPDVCPPPAARGAPVVRRTGAVLCVVVAEDCAIAAIGATAITTARTKLRIQRHSMFVVRNLHTVGAIPKLARAVCKHARPSQGPSPIR